MLERLKKKELDFSLIYHSIPVQLAHKELYRKEIFNAFADSHHVFDCDELNKEDNFRKKAFNFSQQLKTICPHMIKISDRILADNKEE